LAERSSASDRGVFDVVVIGGGVLGTAMSARLATTHARVAVLEAAADVAEGASKGNAGVAASYYAKPGTLDARLVSATYPLWEEVCERLDVPYRRTGAVMVALDEEQADYMSTTVFEEASGCGVRVELLSGQEVRDREPLISSDCIAGLWLPDEGVIDPMRLTVAFAELAVRNGAEYHFSTSVIGFERDGDSISAVLTNRGAIRTRYVVNAAGMNAGTMSALAGGEPLSFWPRKGQFWLIDKEFGQSLRHIVFSTPGTISRGLHVIPTTSGSLLLGPTSEDVGSEDNETEPETLDDILVQARRLVPSIPPEMAIKYYAANRPASDETARVRMDPEVRNLLHLSNRSAGVGASLGSAEMAFELLNRAGLDAAERADAVQVNPPVRKLAHDPHPDELLTVDRRYGQVVCVCENVSAAEIAAALTSPVPARSIAGVWKRTHATGGRCQGSVCAAGVAFMCSLALNVPPEDVPVTETGFLGVK
jgi:glycerol-3-phosphate dehydrogenase